MTHPLKRSAAVSADFFAAQALREGAEADGASLGHVREKHRLAAAAWHALAVRAGTKSAGDASRYVDEVGPGAVAELD